MLAGIFEKKLFQNWREGGKLRKVYLGKISINLSWMA